MSRCQQAPWRLRPEQREALLQGGAQAVVLPGKAKASKLYRLITHQDMPHMPSQAPKLKAEQIARIAEWIDLGAAYDKPLIEKKLSGGKKPMIVTDEDRRFWSFQPLKLTPLPNVKQAALVPHAHRPLHPGQVGGETADAQPGAGPARS